MVVQKLGWKKQAEKLINSEMQMTLYIKCPACLSDNIKKNGFKSYGKRNYKSKTAKGIEGNNCTIRHRVRRAFRRSCNFPKKLENHFKAFDLAFFDVA